MKPVKHIGGLGLESRRIPSRQGMMGWLLQRLSAAIIFAILIPHILVMHYTTPGEPITFAESVRRLQNPLFLVLWLVLLGAVLYHILYGLRALILDFFVVANQKALTRAFFIAGLAILGTGLFFLIPLVIGKPLLGG